MDLPLLMFPRNSLLGQFELEQCWQCVTFVVEETAVGNLVCGRFARLVDVHLALGGCPANVWAGEPKWFPVENAIEAFLLSASNKVGNELRLTLLCEWILFHNAILVYSHCVEGNLLLDTILFDDATFGSKTIAQFRNHNLFAELFVVASVSKEHIGCAVPIRVVAHADNVKIHVGKLHLSEKLVVDSLIVATLQVQHNFG